jgi:hypothetical protein
MSPELDSSLEAASCSMKDLNNLLFWLPLDLQSLDPHRKRAAKKKKKTVYCADISISVTPRVPTRAASTLLVRHPHSAPLASVTGKRDLLNEVLS